VEATPAHRSEEVDATRTMIERVEQKFNVLPTRLVADTAYGAAPMLNWIVKKKKIEPHIPVWQKSIRDDGTFSRPDFRFDAVSNTYECPGGKKLTTKGRPTNAGTVLFRARQHDCGSCALKQQCCPNTSHRKIARSVFEEARDVARTVCATPAYQESRKQRKKVEVLFAHLKRILKLDRLRVRGISGARVEFLLAATAQNLRSMARWLTLGTRDWQFGQAAKVIWRFSEAEIRVEKLDQIKCEVRLLRHIGPAGSALLDAGFAHFRDQSPRIAFGERLAKVVGSTIPLDGHVAVHECLHEWIGESLQDIRMPVEAT
jgi:hypothetical protein